MSESDETIGTTEPGERQPPSLWLVLAMPVSLALTALALVFGLLIGVGLDEGSKSAPTTPTSTLPEGYEEGKQIFVSAGCIGCHTLSDAGSTAEVGPNLDETRLAESEIAAVVTDGRGTGMPAYSGQLGEAEIASVAVYVATAAAESS